MNLSEQFFMEIKKVDNDSNFKILTTTVKFIKSTQQLEQPPLNFCLFAFSYV